MFEVFVNGCVVTALYSLVMSTWSLAEASFFHTCIFLRTCENGDYIVKGWLDWDVGDMFFLKVLPSWCPWLSLTFGYKSHY